MKKSFLILFLFGIFFTSANADENWGGYFQENTILEYVQFYFYNDEGEGHPGGQHVPALLPSLAFSGNTFVLATPYELVDVTIVIRDEDGTVLYYNTVSNITDYYMFQLSDDVIADMFSIELYYGDCHLYGEF